MRLSSWPGRPIPRHEAYPPRQDSDSRVLSLGLQPVLSGKRDLVIADHAGSGKTLAYLAPLAQKLMEQERALQPSQPPRSPRVIVVTPTAELCAQVCARSGTRPAWTRGWSWRWRSMRLFGQEFSEMIGRIRHAKDRDGRYLSAAQMCCRYSSFI